MALRRPVGAERIVILTVALAPPTQTVDRHHVVEVESHPEPAVRPFAVKGRHNHWQWLDEVWCQTNHDLALQQRFADKPEIELLQVAQPAVNELR